MIMPPDFAKVQGDGQPTAGGKRWGLRSVYSTKDKPWYYAGTIGSEGAFRGNKGGYLEFNAPWKAEMVRLEIPERHDRPCGPYIARVVDLDTGEVVPPDDPRLRPPTVDSPVPTAHQWKPWDRALIQKPDETGGTWMGKYGKWLKLPNGTEITLVRRDEPSCYPNVWWFQHPDLGGDRLIGENAIGPVPPTHQWKAGDRARIKADVSKDVREYTWGVLEPGDEIDILDWPYASNPPMDTVRFRTPKCDHAACIRVDLIEPITVPPGKVRVTSGEFAGKVGTYINKDRRGDVYCVIDGSFRAVPEDQVEVGPPAEDDDTGSDESDEVESPDDLDDPTDNQFYIPSSDVCDLAHALSVGVSANAAGDTLTVAQAFGRIEGLLAATGMLDLHEGEDESC